MAKKINALYLSHGGGPMPLLGDPSHDEMVSCLKQIASKIPKPDALIVASAHWEEAIATITSNANPSLIYDYYGFPKASYEIQYPCAGEPALAQELHHMLKQSKIASRLDEERGFDHGTFVPLKIMYPDANIPCVQLSLLDTLDPLAHINLGKALQGLGQRNILLIGSGFSFHNMKAFSQEDPESKELNHAFENWLYQTCSNPDYSEEERAQMLVNWVNAPGARFCHPREEHLLPLHVCYGFANGPCTEHLGLTVLNKKASMYLW